MPYASFRFSNRVSSAAQTISFGVQHTTPSVRVLSLALISLVRPADTLLLGVVRALSRRSQWPKCLWSVASSRRLSSATFLVVVVVGQPRAHSHCTTARRGTLSHSLAWLTHSTFACVRLSGVRM